MRAGHAEERVLVFRHRAGCAAGSERRSKEVEAGVLTKDEVYFASVFLSEFD